MLGPSATVSNFTEAELIARIQARLPPPPDWVIVGIGDDAAVVQPAKNRLEVLSVDALVEGVHFDRSFTPPSAIGHRALAVNLSDLAAMGAEPRLALLSLALPDSFPCADFDAMVDGLAALAQRYGVHVVGGNLTRSPGPLVVDVTVAGAVKRRQALTRRGAKAGDVLYVTGSIGAAAAGLQMLRETRNTETNGTTPTSLNSCVGRYLYPQPRVRTGLLLSRNRVATACMDLSDGLADAVAGIAVASGVGAAVDAEALPIDADARAWFSSRGKVVVVEAVAGGDDYELVFATRPRWTRRIEAAARHGGATITKIGVCTADKSVVLRSGEVTQPMPRGYRHFR